MLFAFVKCIPTLCLQRMYHATFGDQVAPGRRLCNIANYADIHFEFYFVIIRLFYGEQQLIILTAAQGAYGGVEVKLAGGFKGHRVERDLFFVQIAAFIALRANVQDLRCQAVSYIDHGGWFYINLF